MTVIDEIAAERRRQIEVEGWTPEHDDNEHPEDALAMAGACYAAGRNIFINRQCLGLDGLVYSQFEPAWPFADQWWKPKNRRRDLIRAAALIVAEIDRLDREAARDTHPCPAT